MRATQRSDQETKEAWWFIGRLTDQEYQRRLEPRKELGREKRQIVLRRLATVYRGPPLHRTHCVTRSIIE